MNVGYEDLNCADVGRMLKIDKSTIAAWCRKGYINFQDVSEPGSKKRRYLIPEWEFERVKKLIGRYGRKNWLMYNDNKDEIFEKYSAAEPCDNPLEFEVTQMPEPYIPTDPMEREQITQMSDEEYEKEFGEAKAKTDKCYQVNFRIDQETKDAIIKETKERCITQAQYIMELVKKATTPCDCIALETDHNPNAFSSLNTDMDKVLDKIIAIQDIKERIENLEAELNQLKAEREMLKKEITEVL